MSHCRSRASCHNVTGSVETDGVPGDDDDDSRIIGFRESVSMSHTRLDPSTGPAACPTAIHLKPGYDESARSPANPLALLPSHRYHTELFDQQRTLEMRSILKYTTATRNTAISMYRRIWWCYQLETFLQNYKNDFCTIHCLLSVYNLRQWVDGGRFWDLHFGRQWGGHKFSCSMELHVYYYVELHLI